MPLRAAPLRVNPVTRRLLESIADPDLADFALAWDGIEERIVSIYRAGACSDDEAKDFVGCRRALLPGLDRWAAALEPHWKRALIDRAPRPSSPFDRILAITNPQDIIGHWELMRTLPAAREALNGLLLERAVA